MNKSSVLVVEDDMAVRNLISTTLETHDYKFRTAPTG
ncbi:MAG: DNA-binding response regulator, partial [Oscillospiraceae bacterium]